MTYFPHYLRKRPLAALAAALTPVRNAMRNDATGRMLFKPPALPIPEVKFEPLPVRAVSVTHRQGQS